MSHPIDRTILAPPQLSIVSIVLKVINIAFKCLQSKKTHISQLSFDQQHVQLTSDPMIILATVSTPSGLVRE